MTFDKGATIDPRLTVSMKDESVYGYVTKGQSVPLPAGTWVSYRSDRPQVVRIEGGRVRTAGSGVATVTATVHAGGGAASTTFVVRVP
ncbi:hypothetical protein [Actinoallomurus sp. NPDC050550]|uniref:hypothetical protein n=1 Tax=Actinoallomurus sp. NPDC050550 TaxID=3154937 RepID=UPI0033CFAC16